MAASAAAHSDGDGDMFLWRVFFGLVELYISMGKRLDKCIIQSDPILARIFNEIYAGRPNN